MFQLLTNIAYADYILVTPYGRDKPAGPYQGIKDQNPNTQQESNLTNQQDKFNKDKDGTRVDLWPCRAAPPMAKPHVFKRGQVIPVETQSNNMHGGYIEYNIFRGTQVHQALAPSKSGAGFARTGTTITIPSDFPTCGTADKCFLQFYFYSKEPRNYVTCSDFVLEGDVPGAVADINLDGTPKDAPNKNDNDFYKKQTLNGNATAIQVSTQAVKANMMPIIPYSDVKIYTDISTNYEGYAGQSRDPPASALQMWNLTIPGEVGEDAVKNKIMTEKEAGLRKDFRNTIVDLTKAAESVVKCYQNKEKKTLADAIPEKGIMMENKGPQDDNGYFPAAKKSAYAGNIAYKPTPGETYKSPQQLQILSDPDKREDTTTYIDLVGQCINALQASVMKLEQTDVIAQMGKDNNPAKGDKEAEKQNIIGVCAKEMADAGFDCPGDGNGNKKPIIMPNPTAPQNGAPAAKAPSPDVKPSVSPKPAVSPASSIKSPVPPPSYKSPGVAMGTAPGAIPSIVPPTDTPPLSPVANTPPPSDIIPPTTTSPDAVSPPSASETLNIYTGSSSSLNVALRGMIVMFFY